MRLSSRIGLESHFCNITTVSRREAQSFGDLVNPSFSECYIWSFVRLNLSGEEIVIHYRILLLPCIVTFMNPVFWEINSLSCGFMSFSNTTESCVCFRCFGIFSFSEQRFSECWLWKNSLLQPLVSPTFALHSWWSLWNLQSLDQLNNFTHTFSGIFEFWFLECPFLLLSSLRGFGTLCRLNFCQSLSDNTYPFGRVSFNRVNLVKPVHESDRLLFPSTFQSSSKQFFWLTSRFVRVDFITSIYFNGFGNDSFGKRYWTLGSIWWRQMKSLWMVQKSLWLPSSSSVSSSRNSSLSPWDSLSLRWIDSRLRAGSWNSQSLPDNFAESSTTRNTNSPFSGISRHLLYSVFWDIFLIRPTFPILQYQPSVCLPSKFSPLSKQIQYKLLVILSFRIDVFSPCRSLVRRME